MAGATVGTAYLQIEPTTKGIKSSLEKAVGGDASSVGASAGSKIAGAVSRAITAAGLGVALKKTLDVGGALQQSYLGGVDTLYGDAANAVREYAREASAYGVSMNSYAEQAVSFGASLKQAFGGDAKKAAETANIAIQDMADNAAKMGTPLESIQNAYQGFAKQNYTMLDNLKLGYGGTKEEMQRLLADASKLEAANGKAFDINNLGDVYEAIHLIQGELDLTGVAAGEAGSTLTGSFDAMKASAENLLGSIALGEGVGESMKQMVTSVVTYVGGNLIPMVSEIASNIPVALKAGIDSIGGMLKGADLAQSASGILDNIGKGLQKGVPKLASNVLPMIMKISDTIRNNAGKIVDAGLNLVINLATGIANSIPTLVQTIPTIVTNIAGIINDNAPKLVITGGIVIAKLAVGIVKAIPTIVANMPKIIVAIASVFTAFNWANLGKSVLTGIKKGIKQLPSALRSIGKNAVNGIKTAFTGGGIPGVVSKVFNTIKTSISSIIKGALNIVKNTIASIKNAFKFSWSLPHLNIPHISVTGGKAPYGIGGKGSLPKFNVKFYAKAMDTPYMFDKATFFGAGEAGDEILYGRKSLMKDIREASGNRNNVFNVTFNVNGAEDPELWGRKAMKELERLARMGTA